MARETRYDLANLLIGGALVGLSVIAVMSDKQTIRETTKPEIRYVQAAPLVIEKVITPLVIEEILEYPTFKFQDEIPLIERHAARYDLEPELLMAIRHAEDGGAGREYGVLPEGEWLKRYEKDTGYFSNYVSPIEQQVAWAASIISKRKLEWEQLTKEGKTTDEFLPYLKSKWAPNNVDNDPTGLNKNWTGNVKHHYDLFKGE